MSALDPVSLAVLSSALVGIAEEMGAVLIRAAYSSNIKERRDCSTALFDANGVMVAQAEHIPVHLGAMPEAVAAVKDRNAVAGDVFVLNDPYTGGTHLPDITLVSPISSNDEILGYAVSRAHHSDVGGMWPGSMPSDSRDIYQEGLIIPPIRLVERGEVVEDTMNLIASNSRTPELRRGDLRAQLAANGLAQERVQELIDRHGRGKLGAAFEEVIAYAERRTRAVLEDLPDGVYRATGQVEGDGITEDDVGLRATVTIDRDEMTIDFNGTSDAVDGNVNCPMAVTRAACFFALRVLLPEDVPANSGAYAPVTIKAPAGSVVDAPRPSAVVAGNVETSQRVADTVLQALSQAVPLLTDGQGTMNNLIIGGRGWTYYETIGGGQGAGPRGSGPSGVHVGMSNTLNTPIEALELEYPLAVERYELLYSSGGDGVHSGGDGIVRSVRALEAARFAILSDRRRRGPSGGDGGGDGRPGKNLLNRRSLPAKAHGDLAPDDVLTIETPGGGGWGRRD